MAEILNITKVGNSVKMTLNNGITRYIKSVSSIETQNNLIYITDLHGVTRNVDYNSQTLDKQGTSTPEELIQYWFDNFFFEKSIQYKESIVTTTDGVATYHMTDDETANGTPFFNEIIAIIPVAWKNTTAISSIPIATGYRRHNNGVLDNNGKSIDAYAMDSASILLGGEGLEFAPNGTQISITIIYK